MKDFNQFVEKNNLENRVLLYPITTDDVQKKSKIQLTDKQLHRVQMALYLVDSIREKIEEATKEAITMAFEDGEPRWTDIDHKYVESKYGNVKKSRV